jgi:hypothetical protein
MSEAAMPDHWRKFATMSLLGGGLLGQGRYTEAEPMIVAGYEGMKTQEGKIAVWNKFYLPEAAERVVRLYEAWDKPEQATAWKAKLGMLDLPPNVFAQPWTAKARLGFRLLMMDLAMPAAPFAPGD